MSNPGGCYHRFMDARGTAMSSAQVARGRLDLAEWLARIAVTTVFAVNIDCALSFIVQPDRYAGGFELTGVAGAAAVRGLGIAFLMWNATYPLVIWRPRRHRALFGVVLAQQGIGLVGETWLLTTLPAGHDTLASSITRFAVFDGAGLALLAGALAAVLLTRTPEEEVAHAR